MFRHTREHALSNTREHTLSRRESNESTHQAGVPVEASADLSFPLPFFTLKPANKLIQYSLKLPNPWVITGKASPTSSEIQGKAQSGEHVLLCVHARDVMFTFSSVGGPWRWGCEQGAAWPRLAALPVHLSWLVRWLRNTPSARPWSLRTSARGVAGGLQGGMDQPALSCAALQGE